MSALIRKNVYVNPFRLFEEFDRTFFGAPVAECNRTPSMRTDVTETENAYLLDIELPGFAKEEIGISVEGDYMTVSAERKTESQENDSENRVIRSERRTGKCARTFDVSTVDAQNISAKYENGVLSVTLPKKQPDTPAVQTVEIQ
ncbi:MAG: Hsp20/alpha crystallin family protein [Clostridia bacterium]|nr:Hsp20/alpha crystallin family protein [Clostridia bacterium]